MRSIAMIVCALSLAACNNYTTAPLCNDDNAVIPPGLTGIYTLSTQDEDFNVTTEEFEILYKEGTKGSFVLRSQDGTEEESRLCQVGGQFVDESYVEEVGAYERQRLYVTNMGITYLPMFYDKAFLDAAGVPNKVFEMPESYRNVLGAKVSSMVESLVTRAASLLDEGEATLGLMIDNREVPAATLSAAAHAGPIGITLLRK